MEEKERKNEAGSETPKEETKSRREFLRSAAIQGAVAALFGAVTFDSVMARAMGRVSEVQAMRRIGGGAVQSLINTVHPLACNAAFSCNASKVTCADYDCGSYNCSSNFDCTTWYSCTGVDKCNVFLCSNGAASYTCSASHSFSC